VKHRRGYPKNTRQGMASHSYVSCPSVQDWGWTCLHHAASAGQNEIIQILLDAGADINKPDTQVRLNH